MPLNCLVQSKNIVKVNKILKDVIALIKFLKLEKIFNNSEKDYYHKHKYP